MLEVIGAGFGRTGTHSLGAALEILGFGPCYNINQVAKNSGHTEAWIEALEGKAIQWNSLFTAYKSAVEWPTIAFLPEVTRYFPDVKVILTLREPQAWYESASATIFEALELSAHNPDPIKRKRSELTRRLVLEHTFGGRHRETEYAASVYRRHIKTIIELVPPERLLQFHVKEGWAPLCEFLDKPLPDGPFPRVNERGDFLASAPDWAKRIKHRQNKRKA